MVDIRGRAFLSAFGIWAWLGLAVRAGAARRRCRRGGQWMAGRCVGADRRHSGPGGGYGRYLWQRRPDSGLASHADLSGRHM